MTTNSATSLARTGTIASTRVRRPRESRKDTRSGVWMVTPFMVLYLLFLIGPLLYAIVMSFFNSSIVRSGIGGFVGLRNYADVLTDSAFWQSMWHTTVFTVYTTPPLVILAFVFAVVTERLRRGGWFLRFAFFAPYVLPSAAVVLIWGWIYTPQLGLSDKWLSALGITAPNWIGSGAWGMVAVTLLTIWWTIGFNYVLYLSALQEIPRDIHDAAAMDGANGFTKTWRVTVPMVGRTTALVIALQVVASLKVFDQIYLLLSGGPNLSTRPALEYIYDIGFTDYRAGYAAAASMIYFLLILIASLVWLLFSRVRAKEES